MLILAILAMMNADNGPAAPAPSDAAAAMPAPSASEKVCKDVLGRTVKCNPN